MRISSIASILVYLVNKYVIRSVQYSKIISTVPPVSTTLSVLKINKSPAFTRRRRIREVIHPIPADINLKRGA